MQWVYLLGANCCRDRPWQAYPITILTGAYLGFVVGGMLGRSVLFGKRLRFDEVEELGGKKVE